MKLPDDYDNMQQLCAICMERRKNVVFYKCGHKVCCDICSDQLRRKSYFLANCPMCREPIEDIIREYQ